MAKYKITDKVEKEWQGKKFIQATLVDAETGDEFPNIGAWAGEFSGEFFEGELEKSDKGYWKIKKPKAGNPNFKTQQIKEVMDTKRQDVARSMDRKEESIALAGAQRDAVLIVINLYGAGQGYNENEIKENVVKWRNWFLSDDFRNVPPF